MKPSKSTFNNLFIDLIVFSNIVSVSLGQYISIGLCPRIFGMPNFNISQYAGRWYEVEKYWFLPEATAACVAVDYIDKHDGTFAVEINLFEKLSQRKWKNPGTTKFRSRDGSGDFILKLTVTQSPVPFPFKYPYIVVDTDYTSYTIKYHCQQLGLLNMQTMWVLSRNTTFAPETRKKVYDSLRRRGLDSTRLRNSDQGSCPSYP